MPSRIDADVIAAANEMTAKQFFKGKKLKKCFDVGGGSALGMRINSKIERSSRLIWASQAATTAKQCDQMLKGKKLPKCFHKLPKNIHSSFYISWSFQNGPKVNNLFGLLL